MPNSGTRKLYCYVVCLIALLILLWGMVDVISASISLTILKPQAPSYEPMTAEGAPFPGGEIKGIEPSIEEFYQRRMIMDRVGDSFARILVSGLVFIYFSVKIKGLESAQA
jgi:hypothetical protein